MCTEKGAEFKAETEHGQENFPAGVDSPEEDRVSDTEDISREEQANQELDMVSQCLKALFRIGILVRKSTPRDRFERALQQSEFAFPAQFDTNYVEERYPKLTSKDASWLASRLGVANAKRRQFIHYVRDRKAKLEAEDMNPMADASSKATTFITPGNLSKSTLHGRSPLEEEDDLVSLVSASTTFDNDSTLKLPSLSDLGPDGEDFECPICFTLQSFKKEKSWKYVEVYCGTS